MPVETVPAESVFPVPGAPAVVHALWLLTFFLHLVFVNSGVGGSLLGGLSTLVSGRGWKVAELFVELNSWAISLAITFGVAPLLFVQLLYGRFFYTASALLPWIWLGMLLMMAAAYYLNYIAKFRFAAGKGAGLAVWGSALLFLGVTAIQVAVNLLHLHPELWTTVATDPMAAFRYGEFRARFLHFVLAALIFAGILLAWISVRRPEKGLDPLALKARAAFGMRVALVATLFQIADGLWLLGAMPRQVLRLWMRQGVLEVLPLLLSIILSFGLLAFLVAAQDPMANPKRVRNALEFFGATMIVMVGMRHQLRNLYHEAAKAADPVQSRAEWGGFLLFALTFALCLGLTIYAVVRSVKDRPPEGEPVA
ncbi:MAG: hypothetical protein L6R30_09295 [Thermoanaerobaculia bacterium]|nr:hypothetical protein [Thermoanaerobaculia bacterium]